MAVEFKPLSSVKPGTLAALLKASYAELLNAGSHWQAEQSAWTDYDREAFFHPDTVGACLFLTWVDGELAGFGSWDPRQRPDFGIVGHNCILPRFQGKGLGSLQIREILQRLQRHGIRVAKVSTCDHPFFIPAQRAYLAAGFRETRRGPMERDSSQGIIEYEKVLVPR